MPFGIRSLLANEAPKLSGCHFRADWIYVADVIAGFIKVTTVPGIDVRAVVDGIVNAMNRPIEPESGARPDRPDERERVADLLPAAKPRWAPVTSLQEGLRQTVDWYRNVERATGRGATEE